MDTYSGNEHFELPGVSIASRGPGLDFRLAHNSMDTDSVGLFGPGWTSTYEMALGRGPNGSKAVFQETGATVPFTKTSAGLWRAPANFDATLVENADDTWTFTRKRSEIFTFDALGQIIAIADRNGYETEVAYDDIGLDYVEDDAGRRLDFTITDGLVSNITDPLVVGGVARSLSMTYDNGHLATYKDIGGGTWNLTHNTDHQLTSARSPRFTDPAKTWEYHYDSEGRVDWEEDPLDRRTEIQYDTPVADATKVVEPDGDSRVDYYTDGHRTAVTVGYNSVASRNTTTYELDPVTDMVTKTTDGTGAEWVTEYDDPANPLQVTTSTDPLGRTRSMTYDAYGQLLTLTNGEGETTQNTYDPQGNLLTTQDAVGTPYATTTQLVYGDPAHPGDVTQLIDGRGKSWTSTYSASTGDKLSSTDPNGDKTTWTYNAVGWVETSVAPKGNLPGATAADYTSNYTYDRYGDIVSADNPNNETVVNEYDPDGNLLTTTDPANEVTRNTWTDAGELATTTTAHGTPAAQTTTYTYAPDGNLTSWTKDGSATWTSTYDALGRLSKQTDPNGLDTKFGYDKADRLISVTQPGGICAGRKYANCISYDRDDAGQIASVYYTDPNTPDLATTYDDAGRRLTQTVDGTGASAGTDTWTWTPRGEVESHTDAAGQTTGYEYDLAGNLTDLTYPGQTTPVTYTYDNAGRMTGVDDWAGNHTGYSYDHNSNLIQANYPTDTGLVDRWTYDPSDRLDTITWGRTAGPALGAVDYGRDAEGMVTSTAITNNNASIPAEPTTVGYDARDQFTTANGPGAGDYAYDDNGYLTQAVDRYNTYAAGQLDKTARDITLVGTAKASNTVSTSLQVTLPAGVQANDQIVVSASYPSSATVTGGTAGYTTVAETSAASNGRVSLFRRTATGGETSATVTFSGAVPKSLVALVYRGVDTTTPVAGFTTASQNNTTSLTLPTLDVPIARSKLVLAVGNSNNLAPATTTPPAGMTTRIAVNDQSLTAAAASDQTITTAGNTGNKTVTSTQSANLAGVLLALNPLRDSYAYDTRGNRTSSTPAQGTASAYTYDQANRLTAINGTGGYAYNGDGTRVETTLNGTPTHHTWTDNSTGLPLLLTETPRTSGGQLDPSKTVSYIYGPGGQVITRLDPRPDITLAGASQAATPSANSLSLTLPAGIQRDDQILLATSYSNLATPTTPTGYTAAGTWQTGTTTLKLYRRTAAAGETGPVTLTFSAATAAAKSATLTVYRGVDPTNPVVDIDGAADVGTIIGIPILDTVSNTNKIVTFAGAAAPPAGTPSWTPPDNYTVRQFADASNTSTVAADADFTPTPRSGLRPLNYRYSASTELVAAGVVLRQAPTPERWHHADQIGSTRILTDEQGRVVGTASYKSYGLLSGSTGEVSRLTNPQPDSSSPETR